MTSRPRGAPVIMLFILCMLAGNLPLLPEGGAASARPLWTFAAPGGLRGSPALADLDGDGGLETVVSADNLGLVVLDANGSMRWTFSLPSAVVTTPLLADINSDGVTELVAGTDAGTVYALSPGRSLLWTDNADAAVSSDITAADLDGDGRTEVAFATSAGTVVAVGPDGREKWRFQAGGAVRACLAASDINGDGIPELAVASETGRLYILGKGGTPVWNASAGSPLSADPAVSDLDLDGRPEVVTGADNGNVTAFGAGGARLWTFRAGGSVDSSIAVADQDGDGRPEVLFGCEDGNLYCLSPAGALEWTYYCGAPAGPPAPYQVGSRCQVAFPSGDGKLRILENGNALLMTYNAGAVPGSSCAVASLRGDDMPAILLNGNDRAVHCLPLAGIPTLDWRTRQHDVRRTGAVQASSGGSLPGSLEWRTPLAGTPDGPPAAADTDGDGRAEVALATAEGSLYLVDGSSGAVRWRVDAPGQVMRPTAPLIYDLNGDGAPDVAWAGPDGVLRALTPSNGSGLWRLEMGIYEASPAAGDLNGDGRTEIAIGTDSGAFVCVDGAGGVPERTVNLTYGVRAPAALADLGGVPALEAVVSTAGSVHALRNGIVLWSSPGAVLLPTAPLMCDLNSDDIPDSIVGTGRGELCAFSGTDGHLSWNISLGAAVTEPPVVDLLGFNSIGLVASVSDGSLVRVEGRVGAILWKVQAGATTSPSVADLDLDGYYEILVGTRDGLDAFNGDGARLWHFPVAGGVYSAPAIADTDLDGALDIVFGGRDGNLYSLSAGGRCEPGDAPWPQYRHDARRTGNARADAGRFLPDLELGPGSIRPSPAFPDQGGTVLVNVSVANTGAAAAPAFFVSLTDNGTPIGPPQYCPPTEAGAGQTIPFTWMAQAGDHILRAEADSAGAVAELRKDNNAASRSVRVNFRPVAVPGGDQKVDLGAVVLFDGSASRDPDGEISEYRWSFGDGGTAGGVAPTHRYQAFGRFTVTLEVTDDCGASSVGALKVTVNGPPRILDRLPASDVTMAENETRDFTVTAADPEGDPFSVLWRLDGGAAGGGARFTFCPNYSSEGNHTLAAEVSDGSRTVSTGWNISVRDSPTPILTHRPVWRNLSADSGARVSFSIELWGGPATVQWYLDGKPVDGATGTDFELATVPASVRRFTVSVVVNASGHEDWRDWSLEVLRHNAPPSFDRVEPPGDGVLMLLDGAQEFLVAATDPDGGDPAVQWYLDGAALLNETGPQFVYQDRGGRARVNVTVVASDGELLAVHTWTVRVNVPPTALFSASGKTVNEKEAVAFNASPSFDADGKITAYRWSFGDGTPAATGGASASHAYSRAGMYVVELWVTDELGATSSYVQTIAVVRPAEGLRSPGSGGLLALAAVAVLAVLKGAPHRRKKAAHQRD